MPDRSATPKFIDRLQGKTQPSTVDDTSLKASLDNALAALTTALDSITARYHEQATIAARKRPIKRR